MSAPAPIKGKVLKLLSEYSIVISVGGKHGVKKGDRFIVYELGEMIKDTDGKDLEQLELVKGQVQITNVQDSISVGESFKVEKKIIDPFGSRWMYPYEVTEKEPYKLAETGQKPP